MGAQGLMNRPPMWPSSMLIFVCQSNELFLFEILVSAPAHPGPPGPYYNQFHQPRHPRPPFMYQGSGGPMNRPP